MRNVLPPPVTPPGALISAFNGSIGAPSTLASVTRTADTAKPSGKVQPVSSYGDFCGSFGDQNW